MAGLLPSLKILIAEDEESNIFLTEEALKINQLPYELYTVSNGEELIDYLYHRGIYTDQKAYPNPDLLLLDINMPRKNGFEALNEIRADNSFVDIPVVIFSTSNRPEDRAKAEALNADTFIVKPATFDMWVEAIKAIAVYWQRNKQQAGKDVSTTLSPQQYPNVQVLIKKD